MENESRRFEKPREVIDIELDSEDGLAKWRAKYNDGSVDSTWQDAEGLRLDSTPDDVRAFKSKKLEELSGKEKAA